MFTVPKSSDIDRVACKEPEINMLLQRSMGNHIRRQLRKAGIDLNDQTVNQRLASTAFDNGLATIDLSAASDSITTTLVALLLPSDWWSVLEDLRVRTTLIDGEEHFLEMFSSMGNGYTFELESLIFYAITRAVCYFSKIKGPISVYGDDIICSKKAVVRLRNVLHFLGFSMNSKKTHASGYFRESCGKHYYRGKEVTPFYIRRRISTLSDLILALNNLLKWDDEGLKCFYTPALADFHRRWSKWIPFSLHGGIDPSDPSALVTGNSPMKRIVTKTRKPRKGELSLIDELAHLRYYHTKPHQLEFIHNPIVFDLAQPRVQRVSKSFGTTQWLPYIVIDFDEVIA